MQPLASKVKGRRIEGVVTGSGLLRPNRRWEKGTMSLSGEAEILLEPKNKLGTKGEINVIWAYNMSISGFESGSAKKYAR